MFICMAYIDIINIITPRRVDSGGVKRLVLSVVSIRPSVVCPLKNQAISRFTGLSDYPVLNTTVTLKSKKNVLVCT